MLRNLVQSQHSDIRIPEHKLDIKYMREEDPENLIKITLVIREILSSEELD